MHAVAAWLESVTVVSMDFDLDDAAFVAASALVQVEGELGDAELGDAELGDAELGDAELGDEFNDAVALLGPVRRERLGFRHRSAAVTQHARAVKAQGVLRRHAAQVEHRLATVTDRSLGVDLLIC